MSGGYVTESLDDILDSFDEGIFDDILGPDVPDEYKKDSINRRLIEAYEKILARERENSEEND